jgi:4,5-dihydroxyphthalate decarboxylase
MVGLSVDTLTLKTNLASHPGTLAIRDGRVTSDIVTLDCCGPEPAQKAFKDMIRREMYDCGELAIVTYLQAKCYDRPWVLLPAPVSGRFQHHCAGFNRELGHLDPKDIEGRQVGVRTYAQTTGLWIRGILQHEYGVDLDKVTWMTVNEGHLEEYEDPPNCVRLPAGSDIGQMMLDGELTATLQGIDLPKDPRVERLVPDPFEAAKEWFARTGVVPINHIFVVHKDISENRPDVVREIYRMLQESRDLGDIPDPFPPMGLEANRKGLELAIEWAHEQKIIPRKLTVDELFDETTGALG